MSGVINTIKKLFTYKEPVNSEGFELLEKNEVSDGQGEDRGDESENAGGEPTKRKRGKKPPLRVEEWNEAKNSPPEGILSSDLNTNLKKIKQEFLVPKNSDVVIREFKIAQKIKAFIVFIDGMVDKAVVNDFVLRQLMDPENFPDNMQGSPVEYIIDNVLAINQLERVKEYEKAVKEVLSGLTALFIDGCSECILIETRGFEKRSIEKPSLETVIRGAQEAFTENLRTNITLIRRIIKNRHLVTEFVSVGKTNNANCGIMYIEGIVNPDIVKEVKRRIESIDIDLVIGGGMLGQLIEDSPFALFPQVLSTERPDRTASLIMEGRVALIVDGAPFAEVVPTTFFEHLHTSEEAFSVWYFGTFLRFVRFFGMLVSAILPGMYIALTTYHQEMIPTDLLATIALTRENVPFPVLVEVLIMEISFELIREAGIRMPTVIGPALGIIGALILGQAAVAANLVSPIMIIIIAVTGLGSFALPNYSMAFSIRIIRFIFIIFGAIAGFYGISAAIFIIGGVACGIKSFGVPYFVPIAPRTKSGPDIIIRGPIWHQKERPDYLNPLDKKRAGDNARGWTKGEQKGDKK